MRFELWFNYEKTQFTYWILFRPSGLDGVDFMARKSMKKCNMSYALRETVFLHTASRPARLKKRVDVLPYGVKEGKSIFLSVKEIFSGVGPGRKS